MTEVREQGVHVFRELLPGALPDGEASLRDGKFGDEIAEVIYHASGYAGFPAATTARKIAREVLES
jgi:hypothetical protein